MTLPPPEIFPLTPCDLAKPLYNLANGDPGPGEANRCVEHGFGYGLFSVVYRTFVAATYLFQTVHTRGGASPATDDVEVTTTHWRWDESGDPDTTDFDVVIGRLDDFWDGIKSLRTVYIKVLEHRVYNAVLPPSTPGAALYVAGGDITGTATGKVLPPQCATTLTQMTDVRRRWGRFYIGGLTADDLSEYGRLLSGAADLIVSEAADAFANTDANWRLQVFGSPSPNSIPVRSVRCDDVFDIMRSRRYDDTLYRATEDL